MSLQEPFSFGKIQLPSNVFCAPMAGCTDFSFRQIMSQYRPGLHFCEMVKIEALTRKDSRTLRYLEYAESMRPIGAQICGSHGLIAAEAAKMIEDLGFDVVDLNCGCPVDKVVKDGSGSGLLRQPNRIGEIIQAMVAAVKIPVSIKIRIGWDSSQINAVSVVKIAEEAGATSITVHGRTRQQGYRGVSDWETLRLCKEAAKNIKVIGNGDIIDGESAMRMFQQTKCDGVLIARGMLGRPWIIEDIRRALLQLPQHNRSCQEMLAVLIDHCHKIIEHQNEKQALMDMRRVSCWYLRHFPGARCLRAKINQSQTANILFSLLQDTANHFHLAADEDVFQKEEPNVLDPVEIS